MSAALALLVLLAPGPAPYRVEPTSAERKALLSSAPLAWTSAQVIEWGPARYATTFRALWSSQGLYLRWDVTDPEPWHTMTKRDDHLWDEEVVEIFLDLDRSGHDYAELEISPANVACDVRMVSPWPDKKGDLAWDIAGLETRVKHTTDEKGKPSAWTATAFVPWDAFRSLPSARKVALPPKPGDAWRFNVFRIERPGGKSAPEKDVVGVAYSKPPGESFHVPEVFQDFVFASRK